ncbi:uncharacterized protein LOC114270437 [Camellia sinensis]|uniref:uncharacterized protein LOC114270437 n=1 Tax=Camellia sinensis TaxID=4442 RepID=UPI001035A80D|nr:uncharacterized protein LOC114270437 [Camellia sinensis]
MAETLRQQQQQLPPSPPLPVLPLIQAHQADDRTIALTKEFKKMKPPLFCGGVDPLKAEAWVLGIEKLFEVFLCTDAQKVQLAAFTLEGEARRWWMLIGNKDEGINWAQFLEVFYEKYFPQCIWDWKVFEFERLKQGNHTVAEYEAQFTELAKFALHMVDTDYKKARKFEGVLRGSIQERVNVLKFSKYVDVLDRALMSESNMASHNRPFEWKGKMQGSYSN